MLGGWRSLAIVLLFMVLIIGAVLLPISDWIEALQDWIDDFGIMGPPIFFLVYIVAVIILVPGAPLAIAAGIAYGNWEISLALIAATAGASVAFLLARYVAYDKVHGLLDNKKLFKAVEKVVSDEGWRIIILIRISPIVPFNIQNYFFGVPSVRLSHYAAATFVGLIPGTIVNVAIANIASDGFEGGILKWDLRQSVWLFPVFWYGRIHAK
jgi:uncharacterized membrane protein YdjX (TVP38/TMEM64 family)